MTSWSFLLISAYCSFRFSYPYYRTGLGILISTQPEAVVYDPWAFLKP